MNSIIHKYDQLNKKGFDDRKIYGELEGAIKDQTSNDFYEYIAFLLAEYLSDRRPWGCLFGYRCAMGMSDGSLIEHPQINVITAEMVAPIIQALLLITDASRAPELFAEDARVYARFVAIEVAKHAAFVEDTTPEDLADYRK